MEKCQLNVIITFFSGQQLLSNCTALMKDSSKERMLDTNGRPDAQEPPVEDDHTQSGWGNYTELVSDPSIPVEVLSQEGGCEVLADGVQKCITMEDKMTMEFQITVVAGESPIKVNFGEMCEVRLVSYNWLDFSSGSLRVAADGQPCGEDFQPEEPSSFNAFADGIQYSRAEYSTLFVNSKVPILLNMAGGTVDFKELCHVTDVFVNIDSNTDPALQMLTFESSGVACVADLGAEIAGK